jgi:lipid-binding SYLF domain-containing protein
MKKITALLIVICLSLSALAKDKAELDAVIRKLTAKFEGMQAKPDKAIPPEMLRQAQGIVLLDRTKAGFLFAFQGGGGLAVVRDATGAWSAPAFLTANEASLGVQIGGQQSFVVILLMTTNATRLLTHGDIEFGGQASGTAGRNTTGVEGSVKTTPQVLVYDDTKGLYGGAVIKGGAISNDEDANNLYYDQYAPIEAILFNNRFKPSGPAVALCQKIDGLGAPSKSPK